MQTLAELSRGLSDGTLTSRGLTEAALSRIEDPAGEGARAFISVDREGALAAADFMDGLAKRGRRVSPLAGIPFGVKDLFDLAGEVTRAGSAVLDDAAPASQDAVAIARLKAAGLVVLGRTNMTEFAYSGVGLNPHYGTPLSVWDRETGRIPGGSSSGTAVAVADGMCALAIGTDTGGSCRVPAAFNGITGYKSSHGRVSRDGCYPLSSSLDTIGPLANSVTCCSAIDALMAGDRTGHVSPRAPGSLRLGIVKDLFFDDIEPEVAAGFEAAVATLAGAGVRFEDVRFAGLEGLPAINASGGIVAVEAYHHHRAMIDERGAGYDQRVRKRIESGGAISGPDLIEIHRRRAELIAMFSRLASGFDGFFVPTTPNLPPAIAAFDRDEDYGRLNFRCLRNTFAGNFLNCCAIALPLTAKGEAPVSGMVMLPWGNDQRLFDVAAGIEAALAR